MRRMGPIENSTLFYKLEKWLQIHAGKYPVLFYPLYSLVRGRTPQIVKPETQIVIEGYPRSANSFAVTALRQSQEQRTRIANNLHVSAQVIRAARWRIPTLVLLRNPRDAVLSLMVRDPISASQALKYYVSFYETVAKYSNAYVLGLFEEVTENYGVVVDRVNRKFGTDFVLFAHDEKEVEKVFTSIDGVYEKNFAGTSTLENAVSRPSAGREETRRRIEDELDSPRYQELLSRAETVYARLAATVEL